MQIRGLSFVGPIGVKRYYQRAQRPCWAVVNSLPTYRYIVCPHESVDGLISWEKLRT